jgi:transposase
VSFGSRSVVVGWNKRIWCCPDVDCLTKTWTEQRPDIAEPRSSLTTRARTAICLEVGKDNRSVAAVGRDYGIGWATTWSAVKSVGTVLINDPERVAPTASLGFDETSMHKGDATHRTGYVTGVVGADGTLVDVFEGRDAPDVRDWMAKQDVVDLGAVEAVSIDLHDGYRAAITKKDPATGNPSPLAHAVVAADPFHVVRTANERITKVRCRVQDTTTGHRGRKGDPLYGIRKLLACGAQRLDERGWDRMCAGLDAGDPDDEILDAYLAKEHVRDIYIDKDPVVALDKAIAFCSVSHTPEVVSLAKTLTQWYDEILARHRTGASNGRTEAVNLTIKNVKRTGRGFCNFDNYRLRLLLTAGTKWDTTSITHIRGRNPGLVA